MSQPERQVSAPSSDGRVQELRASAHLMHLDQGVFCVVNVSPIPAEPTLAGVRVSSVDPADPNISVVGFRPDGWLSGGGDSALVRVLRGPSPVLITIYQMPGSTENAPKLRVMRLTEPAADAEGAAAGPLAPNPTAPRRVPLILDEKYDVIAHIQRSGDVGHAFGEWVGEPGSQQAIEGFSLSAPEGLAAADFTYQAVLGRGWLSPWVESGQFCGSRGMALPILGLKVKLSEAAAKRYELSIAASFVDGTRLDDIGSEGACEAPSLAPLEAMRITLTPRGANAAKGKAPAPAVAQAKPKAPPAKPAPKAAAKADAKTDTKAGKAKSR